MGVGKKRKTSWAGPSSAPVSSLVAFMQLSLSWDEDMFTSMEKQAVLFHFNTFPIGWLAILSEYKTKSALI